MGPRVNCAGNQWNQTPHKTQKLLQDLTEVPSRSRKLQPLSGGLALQHGFLHSFCHHRRHCNFHSGVSQNPALGFWSVSCVCCVSCVSSKVFFALFTLSSSSSGLTSIFRRKRFNLPTWRLWDRRSGAKGTPSGRSCGATAYHDEALFFDWAAVVVGKTWAELLAPHPMLNAKWKKLAPYLWAKMPFKWIKEIKQNRHGKAWKISSQDFNVMWSATPILAMPFIWLAFLWCYSWTKNILYINKNMRLEQSLKIVCALSKSSMESMALPEACEVAYDFSKEMHIWLVKFHWKFCFRGLTMNKWTVTVWHFTRGTSGRKEPNTEPNRTTVLRWTNIQISNFKDFILDCLSPKRNPNTAFPHDSVSTATLRLPTYLQQIFTTSQQISSRFTTFHPSCHLPCCGNLQSNSTEIVKNLSISCLNLHW